jgi:selenocysteine lyase/cysteine desulfurase
MAGLRFVRRRGREAIYAHELGLVQRLYDRLAGHPGVRFFTPRPRAGSSVPLLSLQVAGQPSEHTAALLSERGIAVRAGLHCAPYAHESAGTLQTGTVRVSFGMDANSFQTVGFLRAVSKLSLLKS